jgi:hypothetical protein
MNRLLIGIIVVALHSPCRAQAPDVAWPREVKAADGTVITVYQPQLERWADNNLSGRAAVSVMKAGAKDPHYGVIELAARTEIDKSNDIATLSSLRITKASFPGASQPESDGYLTALRGAVTKDRWPVSAQALQANLAITSARSQKGVPVKNDPPQILFRSAPTLLVLVDGEPALRPAKDVVSLWRVINTTALILQDPSSKTHYLWALGRWWESKEIAGDWRAASSTPATVDKARAALEKQFDPLEGKDAEGKPVFPEGVTPQLVVATKPTELLWSNGEPQLSPIPGTQLLYVQNSRSDIFMTLGAQQYYVLLSGRWFTAKALTGPWAFVEGKALPADFAKIPADHPMADVMISVPGTPQAREAAIANQIPQTATVQRDVQPTPVSYDGGAPQWKPIDGTPLHYAYNTGAPVIQVDPKSYYMVQNAVWFSATAPTGPWVVTTTVPVVIYSIPPSSPMHYVTYVRVYSSTPTTVFVGYTPGYYGTVYTSGGTVVYGTGYYYPAYVGTYWYPYPPSYGWGWGFTVGMFWGFAIGGGWHNPCCWGGGVYISHHNNINIDNSFNRWGDRAKAGQLPGNRQTKQVGNTTFAKGANNNIYAGRDGDVYRRNESGDWQKYGGKGEGWSDLDRPGGGDRPRPEQRPSAEQRPAQRPEQRPAAETRQSLDRQHQSRQAGAERAAQARSPSAGFHGGGGYRGGGGGGMRGGGGRR